jgi:hypothetical protein
MRLLVGGLVTLSACTPPPKKPPSPTADDAQACVRFERFEAEYARARGRPFSGDPDCVPMLRRIEAYSPDAHTWWIACLTSSDAIPAFQKCMASSPRIPPTVLKTPVTHRPIDEPDPGAAPGASNDEHEVVARNRWRFKECYSVALEKDPAAAATMHIAVAVTPTGHVDASVVDATGPGELTECVRRSFLFMKFNPSTSAATASFTVPVVLTVRAP